jgi:hypothetical protein
VQPETAERPPVRFAPVTEPPPRQSAAATAAEKVRAIVEAAERSATELEQAAREDAARIRAAAMREAESRLGRVRETAARLAERAEELERQVAAIRAGIASLGAELEGLPAGSDRDAAGGEAGRAATPAPDAFRESEPVASVAAADDDDDVDETMAAAEALSAREPELSQPEGGATEEAGGAEPAPASGAGEGARVIALNMALSGTPREQTARYLAENFELDDPDALLDEVYARAGR